MNKLILLLLLASPNLVEAQSEKFILSGRVTDQNNLALPFASVFLEGTEFGTLSNEKGLFLFKAPAGEYRLICKLIGYVDYASTINIGSINPEPIEIRLTDNINELNAVVISAVKV
jgi:hypothetical protein